MPILNLRDYLPLGDASIFPKLSHENANSGPDMLEKWDIWSVSKTLDSDISAKMSFNKIAPD